VRAAEVRVTVRGLGSDSERRMLLRARSASDDDEPHRPQSPARKSQEHSHLRATAIFMWGLLALSQWQKVHSRNRTLRNVETPSTCQPSRDPEATAPKFETFPCDTWVGNSSSFSLQGRAMHSYIRPNTHIALRLPSGVLKILEIQPNTYVA
jgi:hypothetical protein